MNPKYIPNLLSVLRILLVPIFAVLFLYDYPEHIGAAIAVFVFAGVTDVVDGFLARRFRWITDIGKVLDPFADKLMQCMVLFCTFYKGLVPLWLLAFVVLKELFLIEMCIRDRIMSAQKARGADFTTGSIMQRARALIPVFIPLIVSAFRRADELAVAMECRCYHGGEGRTRMTQLHLHGVDFLMLTVIIFMGAVIVALNYLPL